MKNAEIECLKDLIKIQNDRMNILNEQLQIQQETIQVIGDKIIEITRWLYSFQYESTNEKEHFTRTRT